MSDPTYKKIEIVGTSSESFTAAANNAVKKASASVHNLSWFEVVEERGSIKDGEINQYQVTLRIGFRVD